MRGIWISFEVAIFGLCWVLAPPASIAGTVKVVSVQGDPAPDGNGTFFSFNAPSISDFGQAAFNADLSGTSGGSADNKGIFRGDGTTLVTIARKGQSTPSANGTFSTLQLPSINGQGQVAFNAGLTGTTGGAADDGRLIGQRCARFL